MSFDGGSIRMLVSMGACMFESSGMCHSTQGKLIRLDLPVRLVFVICIPGAVGTEV